MTRRRRGAAEWADLIDRWEGSGLDMSEFCRRHDLSQLTMRGWIYKPALKRAIEAARREAPVQAAEAPRATTPAGPSPSPAFLPVRFAEATAASRPPADRAAIEVVLGGGRRVAVGPQFDEETLRRVVVALESGPC
jgi:hypothetical protein